MPDSEAEKVNLEPDSLSFMETLTSREHCRGGLRNGFNSTSALEDHSDVTMTKADEENQKSTAPGQSCPVGLQKAVLLYPFTGRHARTHTHVFR